MKQLVALLEATEGFKPAAEMITNFAEKDNEADSFETKEDGLKRLSDRSTYLGKNILDERTAIETLRDILRESDEALTEGATKLAALEEEHDAAVWRDVLCWRSMQAVCEQVRNRGIQPETGEGHPILQLADCYGPDCADLPHRLVVARRRTQTPNASFNPWGRVQ